MGRDELIASEAARVEGLAQRVRDNVHLMQPHDAEEMRDQLFELAECVVALSAALRARAGRV